jgi:hypothetical protein
MIEPRILIEGSFAEEQVVASAVSDSTRAIDSVIEQKVEQIWEEMLAVARAQGRQVWNGITYRLNRIEEHEQGKLAVEFGPIDFKFREALINVPGYYDLPEEYFRMGAYTSAFLKTCDGYFVFVRLSGRSLTYASENFVGGIIDEQDGAYQHNILFQSLYHEIEEETSIPRARIASCTLRLVALMPTTNVSFSFFVETRDTKDAVLARFREANHDPDIADLVVRSRGCAQDLS